MTFGRGELQYTHYSAIYIMKKVLVFTASALVFAAPLIAFGAVNDVNDLGRLIIDIINKVLVPVLFAIAFNVFLWGAFKTFIWGATSEETKDEGKNLMLWGLIGFLVMASVWGLVAIINNTLGLGGTGGPPIYPTGGQVGG